MLMVGVVGFVAICYINLSSPPIIQMSATTQGPVTCASKGTNWEFKSIDDPACVKVVKAGRAEVEWVK
jgi:hypothetical protein